MDTKIIFKNLKKEQKDFLKIISNMIIELNIEEKITKKKCIDIYNLYLNIINIIENNNNININDINHIILNYDGDNEDVEMLKKFIKIKNIYIIQKVIKSNLWISFIEKLKNIFRLNSLFSNKDINIYFIEKGVIHLLNNTIYHLKGCWEIVNFNDDKIISIDIIEPDDIEFLIDYLKKKILSQRK